MKDAMTKIHDYTMFELSPDAVLIANARGGIVYSNKMCQDLLGWTAEELRGALIEKLIPRRISNHAALREQFMASPSRRPMGAGLELAAQHRSGAEIPIDIALNPVQIDDTPHVVVSLRDMRAHHAALQKLSLLSVAVDSAANGVVITNQNGEIQRVNPAVCAMTGYAAEELVGRQPRLLKSGRHDDSFYKNLWDTVKSGAIWRGTIINRRKDGSFYHEEQAISPVQDSQGVITHFIAIKQDVTERIRAETVLRETRDELARRVIEIEALQARLREQAIRDSLTGLFNRRYLDETLPRELAKAGRDGSKVSLALIDIDHFKRVNDTHGHAVGDRVIAGLSKILREHSRVCDMACRYGGEEFVVVMTSAGLNDCAHCANAWRQNFGEMDVAAREGVLQATFSAGVAEWIPGELAADLIARADAALYQAKNSGRNRVIGAPTLKRSSPSGRHATAIRNTTAGS
jgi:diguanylate cyclase (GGDEF)-like protein/PAS domain S-box-containing protein